MKQGLRLFKKDVLEILTSKCLKCHNPNSKKGDFDLSTRKSLMDSGHIESSSGKSQLMMLIRHQDEPHMPLKEKKLSDDSIAKIAQWIDLGAPYDRPLSSDSIPNSSFVVTETQRNFWSFRPLQNPEIPEVDDKDWGSNPIDHFILHRLKLNRLKPNEMADRRAMIRRAYFGLIGLPPHPGEVESFLKNSNDRAYENVIDRLLDSKHFGERWARHWLDVARFAESGGFEHDENRPNAFHYRDFVIKAFNQDLPYDQFIKWQIAGDELAPENPLALSATGFLGAGVFPSQITEVEFESSRYDELDDMVSTTGVAFLGLSVGCARCHDHKFDPISSRDYYRMVAAFGKTIRSEVEVAIEPSADPVKVQISSEGLPHVKNHADGRGYPHFYKYVYFLRRGDVQQKGEIATPSYPTVLLRNKTSPKHFLLNPPKDWKRTTFQRASLANWITDSKNGAGNLAARVIVNRIWTHHFGQGLVATPNDFGTQGARPTHPKLLDWLANDLVQNGWRLKRLHKLIMMSSTYRQSSSLSKANSAIDPDNQFYWRRLPMRLEAEAIRDAMLNVSGKLDRTMYGPGSLDQKMLRRSVYFTIKRSKLIPMMMLFDWPEHLVSIGRRAKTTTAPQALLLMNSQFGRSLSNGFEKRIEKLVIAKKDQQDFRPAIEQAYLFAFARKPDASELKSAAQFIQNQTKLYGSEKEPWKKALVDFCQALLSSNEFIYLD